MRSTTYIIIAGKTRRLDLTQCALLNAGLRHTDGALLPAPAFAPKGAAHLDQAIALLTRRGLARMEEGVACISPLGVSAMLDTDPNGGPITCRQALELAVLPGRYQPAHDRADVPAQRLPTSPATTRTRSRKPGKLDLIADMLAAPVGASLEDLTIATGWLPHSVRAGMTGLRKQGHSISRSTVDGVTRFAIAVQPVAATA